MCSTYESHFNCVVRVFYIFLFVRSFLQCVYQVFEIHLNGLMISQLNAFTPVNLPTFINFVLKIFRKTRISC